MGYMGLDSYGDSDMASDFVSSIIDKIGKECKKELKNTANEFNTSGHINIALMAEAFLKDIPIYHESVLYSVLIVARARIKSDLEEAKNVTAWRDRDMHVKAYKRMIKNLTKIINNAY